MRFTTEERQTAQTHKARRVRRVTTVNDVLARDDLNEFLADMEREKPNIKHAIIIYTDREDNHWWEMTKDIGLNTAIGLLERTKIDLMTPSEED